MVPNSCKYANISQIYIQAVAEAKPSQTEPRPWAEPSQANVAKKPSQVACSHANQARGNTNCARYIM